MGMAAPAYYTAEMVRALPDDGNRYETVHGELLVTPSPRMWHQVVLQRLSYVLAGYVERHQIGQVLCSPADISWGPDILVQPDLFVADLDEVRTHSWENVKNLSLVVEILSPATTRHDRFTKRRLYQQVAIPTCWIIDADAHLVEVWTPSATLPVVERESLEWHPLGQTEPLVVRLEDLFRQV